MAAVVQVHVTETRTETYTESRDHTRIHPEYLQTPEGIARLVAILILFITVIVCAIAGGATGGWGASVAGFAIVYLIIMFILRLLGFELLFNGLLSIAIAVVNVIVWFVTFIVLATNTGTDDGSKGDAAAAFGFFSMVVWIVLAVILVQHYVKMTTRRESDHEKSDPV